MKSAGGDKPNLFGLGRGELQEVVSGLGEPAYRGKQLYTWLYKRRARSIDEMTDLAKPLRVALAAARGLRWPEVAERALSYDGTVKYLFRLDDGASIESVYIPEVKRRTICLSTQAGCPLKCAFCLTGIGAATCRCGRSSARSPRSCPKRLPATSPGTWW
jgi:23S rRNA (adenine2503-C2)-methyltransferase